MEENIRVFLFGPACNKKAPCAVGEGTKAQLTHSPKAINELNFWICSLQKKSLSRLKTISSYCSFIDVYTDKQELREKGNQKDNERLMTRKYTVTGKQYYR
jgi:hypothetical protein